MKFAAPAPAPASPWIAFLISVLLVSSVSALSPRLLRQPNSKKYLTTKALWFNQTLDHFSPYDHRQFGQRYYEFLDHFTHNGPIFLEICGESVCPGIPNDYISESLNLKLNKSNVENPWFVFGVSYSGALSAWFRLKFPHLTCGSLASSAVIQAIYNFTEFDKQIGISAGPECKAVLQEITRLVDERLASNDKEVKLMFGAAELKIDGDFLYYLADAAVTAFQYGNPDKLCNPLIEAKKAGEDIVKAYATYVRENYGDDVATYNQQNLKKTALNVNSGDRLWWFQVCTEVAYFQVAPSNDSIRSPRVDTRYHLDLCKNVFGEGIYPDVDATNVYYGGTKIAGSKIIFTNGSQDPWRHASKQTSSPDMPSYLISCHNCGHGTDMRGCPQSPLVPEGDAKKCSSPDAVRKVRQKITDNIDLWLSLCLVSGRSSM
ncbi:probable serine protease EDA2 isoform X2 [Olea europaea var. sylvestris]|uniref:probable serine protease EDA2 isoform X2 n=1 Tax=Olea europaea var. sylvestris TaxID=158386 RepID=UPI000C1CEA53|nr:probable serine protease EDA2 isoform X2 [Olea europaea var. sylvestris]